MLAEVGRGMHESVESRRLVSFSLPLCSSTKQCRCLAFCIRFAGKKHRDDGENAGIVGGMVVIVVVVVVLVVAVLVLVVEVRWGEWASLSVC